MSPRPGVPAEPIAAVTISAPTIVLTDVQISPGTQINYWSLSRDAALELRELLDEGIAEFDRMIDRRGRPSDSG